MRLLLFPLIPVLSPLGASLIIDVIVAVATATASSTFATGTAATATTTTFTIAITITTILNARAQAFCVMPIMASPAGDNQPLLQPYVALPLGLPMVFAGMLAAGKATGCISQAAWNRVAGPPFFVLTLLSMFFVSGAGMGFWSTWGVRHGSHVLPAFLIITGTVYTVRWSLAQSAEFSMFGGDGGSWAEVQSFPSGSTLARTVGARLLMIDSLSTSFCGVFMFSVKPVASLLSNSPAHHPAHYPRLVPRLVPGRLLIAAVLQTWSAWIMMHQAAHALRGCFSK